MIAPTVTEPPIPDILLERARAEFLAHGYTAANVARIASAVGMSKKTIYKYVPSKEALFLAVIASFVRGPGFALASVGANASLSVRLTAYLKAYAQIAFSEEGVTFYRLFMSEGIRFPAIAHLYMDTVKRFGTELLADELATHVASGSIAVADAARAAKMLIAMVVADPLRDAAFGLGAPPSGAVLDVLVGEAVDTFLRGVARAN